MFSSPFGKAVKKSTACLVSSVCVELWLFVRFIDAAFLSKEGQ